MSLENKINTFLNSVPAIKKIVKRSYQLSMYAISPKVKYEGDIKRISPDDGMEYFFGYYDKSPWDATDRYMLCLRAKNTYSFVAPKEPAEIVLLDTQDNNSYKVLGKTRTWNVQQGCMLQWLGPDYSERIIYNDLRDGKYCSVILNINTSEETVIPMPIYSVASNGEFALSLDFSRLHRLRPGYGYSNLLDLNENEKCPDKTCIWYINLTSGEVKSLLNYTDFANLETRPEMKDAEHKVNHIMLNPSGNRFMVLHRWINGSNKYTRLVTVNSNGTEMFNLSDDNMTSHCFWKSDNEIIAYAHKKPEGNGYYLMKDKTSQFHRKWPDLISDGHPSYSPDGKMVVTDTYPDRARVATVYIINNNDNINKVARVFAPFRYDNDMRCDLHPRWNRTGNKVCFDSVFEGKRGLYTVIVKRSNINE
ncbi:hypothetical protein [Oceanobacillus polygoni]|uniref:WD40 repeat protein n=1 Tax=Oceanobacillus polygoni TaxID=1235259 RepID=A0A9X0YRH0_9BACI|nr:hypothetical protein [Oceanobacillus polygoni]MBP2075899.1 hypothetical protein [Oceanobacillus polygoni]